MPKPRKRKQVEHQSQTSRKIKRAKFTIENVDLPKTTVKGQVLVTGGGDVGQLGLGPDVTEVLRPREVSLTDEIVDVCAGGMHTVCLTSEGKVLTFGCNDEGALGRPAKDDEEFEAAVVNLPGKVIQISAGDSHTAALLEGGKVYAWGTFRDSHGNMGMSLDGNERTPYEIIKDLEVKKIASGADHLVFLTAHGEVYTCGCAEQGQLGRTSERSSGRNARSGIGKEQLEKLLKPGLIYLKPSLKLHFDNIWATTYGTFCKVAGKKDIYVFGLNNFCQLGLTHEGPIFTATLSPQFSKYEWLSIVGGQHHALGLTKDHTVYTIGRKEYGRLGLGTDAEDAKELQLVKALKEKKIIKIACGSCTSFAVTKDGELYAWGMGTGGPLGTGKEDDCVVPTLIEFSKKVGPQKVFRVSSGGQHTVLLSEPQSTKNNNNV